ncbi:hypothetical protein [Rhizobium sp. 42MFCr.1]|uniref:hypothetical protein n=1 Tax=Rhizobium sp. 42MFCr.1 TaxID=1048680 RepID=UPI000360DD90|nr:hypothetical protein [Rhizobium sp. 42MFCr.1]
MTSIPDLPEPVAAEMKAAEAAITSGKLKPLPARPGTRKARVKVTKGQELADADIRGMTWSDRRRAGRLPDPVGEAY